MDSTNNFFSRLEEGEEYVNVSMSFNVFSRFKGMYEDEKDYTINHIKQKNKSHKEHEVLMSLYKEKRKVSQEIQKIEQNLNHHKKD